MRFTVFGGRGFIGRRMVQHLLTRGFEVSVPVRDTNIETENLGHVIYAIGLTGDFRMRMSETIDAHINVLQKLMNDTKFESWLYLSSTRLYDMLSVDGIASEDVMIPVRPNADAIYNLSKLLGEAICLANHNPYVRIARLSNVYGPDMGPHNFLGSIVRDSVETGRVIIGEAPQSAKDYISIDDVVRYLENIALHGTERLYNVASGQLTTHDELASLLRKCGYDVQFSADARLRTFPQVDVTRVKREFSGVQNSIFNDLRHILENAKNQSHETV